MNRGGCRRNGLGCKYEKGLASVAFRWLNCVLIAGFLMFGCYSAGQKKVNGAKDKKRVTLTVVIPTCLSVDHPARSIVDEKHPWIEDQVRLANEVYLAAGIQFDIKLVVHTAKRHARCELLAKKHRDSFSPIVSGIHQPAVIIVDRIQDDRIASYDLKGLHWRAGLSHWVYLTRNARSYVLAHELGHYFGLRHDLEGGNLMTPGPSDPSRTNTLGKPHTQQPLPFQPVFSREQLNIIKQWIDKTQPVDEKIIQKPRRHSRR